MNRNIANSQIRKAASNGFKDAPGKQKIHLSLFSALNLLPTAHFSEMRQANNEDSFSDYMERAPGAHPGDAGTARRAAETSANSLNQSTRMKAAGLNGRGDVRVDTSAPLDFQWENKNAIKVKVPGPSARTQPHAQPTNKASNDTIISRPGHPS